MLHVTLAVVVNDPKGGTDIVKLQTSSQFDSTISTFGSLSVSIRLGVSSYSLILFSPKLTLFVSIHKDRTFEKKNSIYQLFFL